MSQLDEFNQMSSDKLLAKLLGARAMLFGAENGRHGIDKKIELRAIIGGTSQVIQRRRQQGEEIAYESHP